MLLVIYPFLYMPIKSDTYFCLFYSSKQNCFNNMENSIVCKCHAFWTIKWDFDENYSIEIKESDTIWIDVVYNENIIKELFNFEKKPKINMNFECCCVKTMENVIIFAFAQIHQTFKYTIIHEYFLFFSFVAFPSIVLSSCLTRTCFLFNWLLFFCVFLFFRKLCKGHFVYI